MSTKGKIYKTIADHLMNKVEGLKMVDKNKGQLDNISQYVLPLPAVLISFGKFHYKDIGSGIKQGEGTIKFKVAFENYADSYTGSINQEQALAFFDFNEAVQEVLESFSGEDFSELNLIADEDDENYKNVIVTDMEYELSIINRTGDKTKNYVDVEATPKVKYIDKEDFPKPPEDIGNKFLIDM